MPLALSSTLSTAITQTIVMENCDTSVGVRKAAKLGSYCAVKCPPFCYQTLCTEGVPGSPEAICMRGINEGRPCTVSTGVKRIGYC